MSGPYTEDDLLPLSGIQHFAFCERQWALIHVEQQWAENVRTVEGHHLHERAHNPLLRSDRTEGLITRSLPVVSWRLGLSGRLDVVEFTTATREDGGITLLGHEGLWSPRLVEYKRGRPKPDDRDQVQLCAQAVCLEEMLGVEIPAADLYYGETRRRQRVELSNELRERVEDLCRRMRETFARGDTPQPARGKRCSLCSLMDICLPGLMRKRSAASYIRSEIEEAGRPDG